VNICKKMHSLVYSDVNIRIQEVIRTNAPSAVAVAVVQCTIYVYIRIYQEFGLIYVYQEEI